MPDWPALKAANNGFGMPYLTLPDGTVMH